MKGVCMRYDPKWERMWARVVKRYNRWAKSHGEPTI